jgi:hypothetical protein
MLLRLLCVIMTRTFSRTENRRRRPHAGWGTIGVALAAACVPNIAWAANAAASAAESAGRIDLTTSWVGYTALTIFALAYALVMAEETLHLRKSKPVLVAAGVIWALIGWRYQVAASAA